MYYYFDWNVVLATLPDFLTGLALGLLLAAVSLLAGMVLGFLFAIGCEISGASWLQRVASGYVLVFRNTPLLVLVFIAYFGLPTVGVQLEKNLAFVLTLSLYAGAYMYEVFRAGLRAIPVGLVEAGKAIGLRRRRIVARIQIPIMVRNVLPSLSNYLISLFKDSSLASSITIVELTYVANKLTTETFRVFEAWITAGVLYLAMCVLLSVVLRQLERRMAL